MKKLILLILFFMPATLKAQKTYVWCPEGNDVKVRSGFLIGDTLDIVVFDGRSLGSNSKEKCSESVVINSISELVRKAYPEAICNFIPSTSYYADPTTGHVTVKVGIAGYHAGFGTDIQVAIGNIGGNFSYGIIPKGEWNGITAYVVKLYDYRKGEREPMKKDISRLASHSNMFGYKTAKNVLKETYNQANQDLLFFIDECLMK